MEHLFTSENLLRNGSFTRLSGDAVPEWRFVANSQSGVAWEPVVVPGHNHAGLPHSRHAIQLRRCDAAGDGWLEQEVAGRRGLSARFALRFSARAGRGSADCAVAVRIPGGGWAAYEFPFTATTEWRKHRFVFELSAPLTAADVLHVQIHCPRGKRGSVAVTDAQLVSLLRPVGDLAVRFDTCGGFTRASSRLRAWLLADYLELAGARTSLNEGRGFAVYVCQKTHPFGIARRARQRGAVVVYDLDDNEFVASPRHDETIRRFLGLSDAVTAGSEFLREKLGRLHPRTWLVDNPVDLLERDVVRPERAWARKLVWFGGPENLWMLRQKRLRGPVTAITRGGDIEYDVKGVDRELTRFDLALLPVAWNEETAAKNANRLIKCAALGLPFLATDTPEHRRALAELRLPEEFLVGEAEDWDARIEEAGRHYERWRAALLEARPRLFAAFGIEAVASKWLECCLGLLRETRTTPPPRNHLFSYPA